MSFFTDVLEWGSSALDTAYDYAEDAYDWVTGSSGVTEGYDYAWDDPNIFERAWNWTTETAESTWDWITGESTSAGVARDLTKEVAGSFLSTDASGRRINIPEFKRSQARTQIPTQSGQPSLYDMGYTPRALQRAQQARNSSNQYVQGGLRLVSENIRLGGQTITLGSAGLPSSRIARKYIG